MASEEANGPGNAKVDLLGASLRIGLLSLLAGLIGVIITAWLEKPMTAGFAAGYIIGFVNVLWLVRIVGRGMGLAAEKAIRFVLSRYYLRFVATAVIVAVLALKEVFSALPLIAGLASSFFITVLTMILVLRKEFFSNA